ncbi:MAG: hypothetical protein IMW93_05935 [Thermoanaerobacteraceae bacterium]|nr:hypothetical protein [Thermoanaerobacteraceae bacterium]
MNTGSLVDYRVNHRPEGQLVSVEITCCGQRIGEIRFKDRECITCPHCGLVHLLSVEHNHFHIRQQRQAQAKTK